MKVTIGTIVFLLVASLPALYIAKKRLDLIQNSTLESATITSCSYKDFRGKRGKRSSAYTPVAFTADRVRVVGTSYGPKKACERRLYRDVSVYIHDTDPTQNSINSFLQLWMIPAILAAIPVFILLIVLSKLTKGRSNPLNAVVFGLVFIGVGAIVWKDHYSTPKSSLVTDGSSRAGGNEFSVNTIQQCINESLHKEGVSNKQDIKKISCQGAGLTDLSALEGLESLEELYIQNNKLDSIVSLPYLPNLQNLSIAKNGITHLEGITNAPNLVELQANMNEIRTIDGLEKLSKLRILAFMYGDIKDLSPLKDLNQLEEVLFNYNKQITDISMLANKPELRDIRMYNNSISDISPLFENRKIEVLGMIGTRNKIPCAQVYTLLETNPIDLYDGWEERCVNNKGVQALMGEE